ncbi:hypothetical protein RHSIM_Rhsim03G0047700 [Rhododendron simsii]|uniref:PGG domain-containing protein n=1 Tax=Rhododendron simsii TaxID=118357 RepID=A0A834H9V3_RHOSS|nr:hypothetical protein RHSIM_Rhsim03G0047700 [Rhododendron simsii]
MEVAKLDLPEVERIFKPVLRKATCVGIPEIIEEIVLSYPSALFFVPDNENIIKYAILNRREHVFNLVHRTGWKYIYGIDNSLNNVLHLAARLGREQQINHNASAAGAVLQMQRERQWYEEVQERTPPADRESKNIDGMTPTEVFSETHQDLVKEAERWIKETATSCTIVAVLVATTVFAAAITVPDEDFLRILPERLSVGFITLYVSILSMMIAFGAILYLVFGYNKAWVLISIVASAGIPVTLFGAFQFPLLVEMIQSTYRRNIFHKQLGLRALR